MDSSCYLCVVSLLSITYARVESAQIMHPLLSSSFSLARLGILGILIALLPSMYLSLENLISLPAYVHRKKQSWVPTARKMWLTISNYAGILISRPMLYLPFQPIHQQYFTWQLNRLIPTQSPHLIFHCPNKIIYSYFLLLSHHPTCNIHFIYLLNFLPNFLQSVTIPLMGFCHPTDNRSHFPFSFCLF